MIIEGEISHKNYNICYKCSQKIEHEYDWGLLIDTSEIKPYHLSTCKPEKISKSNGDKK